tara:strand:+ start:875 stop:2587 length:1713 start_codon:yes stop_codon:yes gene_type:complete
MADESGTNPFIFACQGGLVLNRSTFTMEPGQAFELVNFEPDIKGGYRRINGYNKWNSNAVPLTANNNERVLMSAFFEGEIIAARGEKVYRATDSTTLLDGALSNSATTITLDSTTVFSTTGTIIIGTEQITYTGKSGVTLTGCSRGTNSTNAVAHLNNASVEQYWTEIDTGRTNATKYSFFRYNLAGTETIVFADGANNASYYTAGNSVTNISSTGAPSNPKIVTGFKNTFFFAGMSSNPQELVFTAPYDVNDFTAANGAGSIRLESPITGLFPFRDNLFIFCEERIFKLAGNTIADFQLIPVSRAIGCVNGNTIREMGGDIIFLGRDGLRTIAGTANIGDVELGSISSVVQQLFTSYTDLSNFESVVVPNKTQYRIFFSVDGQARESTNGVICHRTQQGYEFSETLGIQPSCTDATNNSGSIYAIHGGFDGYVYRQEQGSTFDGVNIIGRYRSPDLTLGDAGLRKNFQRVIINYQPEGVVRSDLFLRYDYEDPKVPRPAAYPFDSTAVVALYGLSVYGTATYGGQSQPLVRQSVEGSGFAIALRVVDNGTSEPYSIKGFQLEFDAASRR